MPTSPEELFTPENLEVARRVFTPHMFNGLSPKQKAQFSDEDIAEMVKRNYETNAGSKHTQTIGGGAAGIAAHKMGPKTLEAILEHPNLEVPRSFLHTNAENKLSDEQFHKLMARAEPTVNGVPATPEQLAQVKQAHNPHNPEYFNKEGDELVNNWWNENRLKDLTNDAVSRFKPATASQLQYSMDRLKRNHPSEQSGDYYDDSLSGYLGHPNISSEQVKKIADERPYMVAHTLSQLGPNSYYGGENHPTQDPAVINHVYNKIIDQESQMPSTAGNYGLLGKIHDPDGAFSKVSPESLQRTWDIFKKQREAGVISPLGTPEIARHPNASPETLNDVWEFAKKEPDYAIKRGLMPSKELASTHDPKTIIGNHLAENPSVPHHVLSDIIKQTDANVAHAPAATPEHHKQMLDKAMAGGYYESPRYQHTNEEIMGAVKEHTKDPNILRHIFEYEKKHVYPSKEEGKTVKHQANGYYEPYINNPNTPSDVLKELHEYFPDERLMGHGNFPAEYLQQMADAGEDKHGAQATYAKRLLAEHDPDKYSYQTGGPGDAVGDVDWTRQQTKGEPKKGREFGSTEIKPGLSKLRVFRDKILEQDPQKGELSPKDLGQGPFGGNWKPVQEKNGNISAKKIQELIDSHPSTKYNFAHEEWEGAQRHSEHRQRVFKLNVSSDHIKKMKEAGVYNTFKKLSEYSNESGHPSDRGHTIGWVRYEHHTKPVDLPGHSQDPAQHHERNEKVAEHDTVHHKPEAIHVDEIQSDMGPNTAAKLKERPERAKSMGVDPDHIDKINDIVFGKHHPSEVLMEAFKQHKRDQGQHDVPIHMLSSKTKAPISGQSTAKDKPLPAHMQFTYEQMPKKMGMTPGKYGSTHQQDNPQIKANPGSIWSDKIRKFEEELINKALGDIKVGKQTHEYPADKQAKLPQRIGGGRTNIYDYNHLLSPQHKRAGYQMYVEHRPDHKIYAHLFHRGAGIGDVEGVINPYNGTKLRISSASIGDDPENPKHRGKGLGTAMYEAVLAHARNHAGIDTVHGTSHSSMAHAVHNKVAKKHGLAYKALPNYMEGSYQHWPDQEAWESAPTGPFDDKYGAYEYMIKSENDDKERHPFRAAGFKHKKTGQIVETGPHHDISKLPHGEDTHDEYTDGFIDHAGTFHDRHAAAKIAQLSVKLHHRKWLDSYDKESGLGKNEDGVLSMLEQDDPMERILALKSAKVMPHHILIAINDEDPQVRSFAATHHMITGPLLLECLRQCKAPDTFRLLLGHDSCDDSHINYALETDWGGNGGPEDDGEPL